jgi:hypothetical protein
MMRKGVSTAASVAQGRDVPRLIEFPIDIAEPMATPAMLRAKAIESKKADGGPQIPKQ